MNTSRTIKLIKNVDRQTHGAKIAVELAVGPNRWSTAVRSWVVEFQERDRSELLPAFDSLFKDAPPPSSPGAKSGAG
jgi:hypothetical protein